MRAVARGVGGIFLAWVLLTLVACGGGGGGGSNPPPTQQSASFSYPSGAQTFTVGAAITPVKPTINGSLNGFSASSQLPAGLSVDPDTGVISGTPTAVSPTKTYTVNGFVSGGTNVSAMVTITVNDVSPSAVSYGATSFTFSAGVAVQSPLKPNAAGGTVVSWSITPALPQGLEFNTADGSISGTPGAPVAAAQYIVAAQNSGGQSTVTLTIAVDVAPLLSLGHQNPVVQIRSTSSVVLSLDYSDRWVLWNYASATIIASGASGCLPSNSTDPCLLEKAQGSYIDVAGPTAVVVTSTGLEVHSTSDGSTSATISTSGNWWKLATDGSYIVAGSSTGVSAWSPSGQQLFSNPGDYSKAIAFAAPGAILIGLGAAGTNAIETLAVPSGTSSLGATFNGTFSSWFVDGQNFISVAGSTALIYSGAATQIGSITSFTGTTLVGQGNWVWTFPNPGAVLNIYHASGPSTSTSPAFTYSLSSLAQPVASGTTIGIGTEGSSTVSVIDLSGSTPTKTDYSSNVNFGTAVPVYTAVSASQWMVGTGYGVLADGATIAGTPRLFGYGEVWSIAAGTGHFAVATAAGSILYFNSVTLAKEGEISFNASKIALSADGTLLVAQGAGSTFGSGFGTMNVQVYSLPSGALSYTWSYPNGSTTPYDIELSASGSVLAQLTLTSGSGGGYMVEASAPTGGSQTFSSPLFSPPSGNSGPGMVISPDGTLIAYTPTGIPESVNNTVAAGTDLVQNGSLVTAFAGIPVGWLDNSRLVVNNFSLNQFNTLTYTGCTLYGTNGAPTGGSCALTKEIPNFQTVTSDTIYVPLTNQILSVSTGNVIWASGDSDTAIVGRLNDGGVTGHQAIFISGIDLVAQSY